MATFIYTDQFNLNWDEHIFPVEKYSRLHRRLINDGLVLDRDILSAPAATDAELLRVHHPDYLERVKRMTLKPSLGYLEFEAPVTEATLAAVLYATGASILACEKAAETGMAMTLSGGFHHAFADHGEGFCIFNDVAVAIRATLERGLYQRVLVVDCDLHQGNGTAKIFEHSDAVFTFSIHQENNYPLVKERSDCDIGLDDYASDQTYLDALERALPPIVEKHRPDLIFYLAGADPFKEDQLGSLMISKQGLKERDDMVIQLAKQSGAALAVALAGGYARRTDDVVDIHFNTARLLQENSNHVAG